MVKQRDKCGQLLTSCIEKCLWSWEVQLVRGVPGTEGVKNRVISEVYVGKEKKKNMKKKGRKERKKKRGRRRKK